MDKEVSNTKEKDQPTAAQLTPWYEDPNCNLESIVNSAAPIWSGIFGSTVTPEQVCLAMAVLKSLDNNLLVGASGYLSTLGRIRAITVTKVEKESNTGNNEPSPYAAVSPGEKLTLSLVGVDGFVHECDLYQCHKYSQTGDMKAEEGYREFSDAQLIKFGKKVDWTEAYGVFNGVISYARLTGGITIEETCMVKCFINNKTLNWRFTSYAGGMWQVVTDWKGTINTANKPFDTLESCNKFIGRGFEGIQC